MVEGSGKVGRPRAGGPSTSGLSPREEILGAAAKLFTTLGYGATTTREIADRAGLRQASLYYHFAGKDDILAALLEETMRPLLALARELAGREEDPDVRLWVLCHAHIRFLASNPDNLGALYLLPELRSDRFAEFHGQRRALKAAYRTSIESMPGRPADHAMRGHLVFALVEGVILLRREQAALDAKAFSAHGADAALRLAGCPEDRLAHVQDACVRLRDTLVDML
jgi:AcrR family transcriptional regulator